MSWDFDNDDGAYSQAFYQYDHLDQVLNQGGDPHPLKYNGPWYLGCMEIVEENGIRKLIPPKGMWKKTH